MTTSHDPSSGKPIGFKTLQEITGYVSVHDGNVIRVTVNIGKILKTQLKDQQGMPVYNVTSSINILALTQQEYDAMMKPDFQE